MEKQNYIITAGSTYLDIDAYACAVSLAELMKLQGKKAIAYSKAPCNYSVCKSLVAEGQIQSELPQGFADDAKYIIVDVSDCDFLKDSVPLERVVEIYDHHVGFEEYWESRIGKGSHIEFIGCAATLIYREWKKCGLLDKMLRSTALLMIAAILDNTLNLKSSNTTEEDKQVFYELCLKENVGQEWCEAYFSEVQRSVVADIENALFNDIKTVNNNSVLPKKVAQLCVWDSNGIMERLPEIRKLFSEYSNEWMINIIDLKQNCCFFVCDNAHYQKQVEKVFQIAFEAGVAKTDKLYLRKEIYKKAYSDR